jgi:putative nucleotidyltransferase with HDIG domain
VHQGARVVLLVVVAIVITAFFPPVTRMDVARHELGTLMEEDLIAQVPFAVPKSPDELARERDEAAAAVPPTFDFRPEASDSMAFRIEAFFAAVDSTVGTGDSGTDELEAYLGRVGIRPQPAQLDLLVDEASRAVLRSASLRAAREILPRGVIESEADITTGRIAVRLGDQDRGYIERSRLMTSREFLAEAEGLLGSAPTTDATDLLRLILIRWQEYNYTLNVVATEVDRSQAREAVGTTKESILVGEAIVRANQQIRETEIERLSAYEAQLRMLGLVEDRGVDVLPFIGSTLMAVLLIGVFGMLVFLFRPEIYSNYVWLLLLAGLIVTYVVVAWTIQQNQFAPELLPIAFVALGAAVLWDGRMALVLVLMLALLTGTLPAFSDYGVVVTVAVGGAAAALSVRAVRRRAQTWIFVAIISAAYAGIIVSLSLVNGVPAGGLLASIFWGAANATASAILAMGFLPVFEWITGITTDQTLLEWADPNRSLLKRLSMEAPGTHSHSIQVANLAEAGATAIGANGLLCRVGAYYHDVGKVLKPQYFIENQPEGRNPHDKLKPSTSAQVVREHVTEGQRLARETKVPRVISDFIVEHHGTQRITYFYQKALDEAAEGVELDESVFTYPGPRPQSRETAVCMLADSVESATRVLQDATPERVRELVHNLIAGKIADGQLDDADLTLREIATLEDQFVKMVSGMYHHRIDYPATRHLTEAPNGGGNDGAGGSGEPHDGPPAEPSRSTAGPAATGAQEEPTNPSASSQAAERSGGTDEAPAEDVHEEAPQLPGLGQ